ncbi:MFS transporter [Microvirga sp. SYSU G3D207]|uniref:MFS transporter n=1 Tax=Microvirga arsenatis TaxID=2692265 RepID=A0ABW9YS43_9HYPH|nr:MFS transporter [Microvirga arsenatis]NBJ09913.1 MFS transporter [Microvirga arsenatis]NBJ22981.1 MFS transporter [Microvirga arsenatis]
MRRPHRSIGGIPVRAKDFAFFLSLFFARLADQMLLFLVPLVVFQITQSASLSGLAFFIETLPRYLLFSVCGILCDRRSPMSLLVISQRFRLLTCAVGVAGHELLGGIGWLVALSAVCGILSTQGFLAREVMLPQIFRQQRFEKVLSYSQLGDQLGMVIGPLLAAALLGLCPWQVVVGITAFLFLLADLGLTLWHRSSRIELAPPEAAHDSWVDPFRIALKHIWHLPGLRRAAALSAGLNFVFGATLATSAAMVTGIHGQSEQSYALLQTASAVASIAILTVLAHVIIPLRAMGAIGYTAIFIGGLLTAISPNYGIYAAGYVLVLGFDRMFTIYLRSLRQKIIPQKDFGKTTGAMITVNNLSQPLAGLLVGLFSGPEGPALVIGGISLVMGFIGVIVAIGAAPVLKQANR